MRNAIARARLYLANLVRDFSLWLTPEYGTWVCPVCGTDDVHVQMWVDANTDRVMCSCESYHWCNECDLELNGLKFLEPGERFEQDEQYAHLSQRHGIDPCGICGRVHKYADKLCEYGDRRTA